MHSYQTTVLIAASIVNKNDNETGSVTGLWPLRDHGFRISYGNICYHIRFHLNRMVDILLHTYMNATDYPPVQ